MIKLVVTDIDDTLLNSDREISKKNREVIEECKKQDI
ncbi:HAD family hydrolase, partial [Gemella sp.]